MSNFITISKQEFEDTLNDYTEGWIESIQGKEYVFKYSISNKTYILVFSSVDIASNKTRDMGKDAVRCVLYDAISNRPLGKVIRTNRTEGWSDRLKEKLGHLEELSKKNNYPRCGDCFSVMVKRQNKTTGRDFLGCTSYPDYCKGSKIYIRTNRILGYLNALPDEIPEPTEKVVQTFKGDNLKCFDRIVERYDYLATLQWIKSRIRDSSNILKESNLLFSLVDDLRDFSTEQRDNLLERDGLSDASLRDLIPTIKNWRSDLTMPVPNKIELRKAIPLGMEEEIDLAPSESFPYMGFDFEYFNPAQTIALPYVDQDSNIVVAAPTASGKTVVAEMVIARALELKQKAVYLAPMKALAEEKYSDFIDETHHFSQYSLSVMSGDYTLTTAKQRELQEANIIIMTNEMLATRSRMFKSEKNDWLNDIGCLVVDEAHLIGISGRGDATESAMMIFSNLNPKARLILLSATMPNCIEMAKWVQVLNGKDTALVESDYRPCKIEKHYLRVPYNSSYQAKQYERMKIITSKLQEIGFR